RDDERNALRRVSRRMQYVEHDRVREAMEPAPQARAGRLRRRGGRQRASQAGRYGSDPTLQPRAVPVSAIVRLGIRTNLGQFTLLVVVNAFVGAMVGLERTILPAIAEHNFHLAARTAILSFIVVFGITKALTNYFAGRLSDAVGRKLVLVGGW